MKEQPMFCAYCVVRRTYPQDFPDLTYAICTDCYASWAGIDNPNVFQRFWRWWRNRA